MTIVVPPDTNPISTILSFLMIPPSALHSYHHILNTPPPPPKPPYNNTNVDAIDASKYTYKHTYGSKIS